VVVVVHGQGVGGVAEDILRDLRVYAFLEHEGRRGMAQVLLTSFKQPGPF
jgi:hypothetical protein